MAMTVDYLSGITGYWYLASPYTKWPHGLDDAALTIARLAGELIVLGVPVYSPIAYTHEIARVGQLPMISYDLWMSFAKTMLLQSQGIIIADMIGWGDSVGVTQELKWAAECKKPAFLLNTDAPYQITRLGLDD